SPAQWAATAAPLRRPAPERHAAPGPRRRGDRRDPRALPGHAPPARPPLHPARPRLSATPGPSLEPMPQRVRPLLVPLSRRARREGDDRDAGDRAGRLRGGVERPTGRPAPRGARADHLALAARHPALAVPGHPRRGAVPRAAGDLAGHPPHLLLRAGPGSWPPPGPPADPPGRRPP